MSDTRGDIAPAGAGGGGFRVLALLWHAPQRVITAGGFRRTYEILERTPEGVQVYALDDHPSFLSDIEGGRVRVEEYRIPRLLRALQERFFFVERISEWVLSTFLLAFACFRLRRRGERFDLIYVPSSEQVPALLAGLLARLVFGAPLVACNLNLDIFPERLRGPLARLHNGADVVIAISEHLESSLKKYGLRAPVEVNAVGLEHDKIASVPAPAEKSYEAVFVGRHDSEKGVFDLIEIWRRVRERHPEARLVMVGSSNPGCSAKLDRLIAESGLEGAVIRAGTVDDETKYTLIKGSRICVFPSYVEEWGIVPQEALACGLPVVAYDLPVYKENIAGCEAVFLVAIGDVEAMADRAADLLRSEEYLRYASVGPAHVSRFDWDEVTGREFEIMARGARVPAPVPRLVKRLLDAPPAAAKRAFKGAAVALYNRFASARTFTFGGREFHYFYHPYNLAWRNERAVEVPIARAHLEAHRGQAVLEVGNVLSHYIEVDHAVLDKYESAPGVVNLDAVDFDPGITYDLIISVSTLEHVGWDESPREPDKALAAIENLAGLLAPGGELVATAPLGLNPDFDALVAGGRIPFTELRALRRVRGTNRWVEDSFESVAGARYNRHSFRADAIIVGRIVKGGPRR